MMVRANSTSEGGLVNTSDAQRDESSPLGRCCHPACLVCGERNQSGLGLRFEQQPDGSVLGRFACDANYQGYPDRLHGGVVSMLLDAAMTNCLFAKGIQAVTARMNVRFRHPVRLSTEAVIQARLVDQAPPLYVLKAELLQAGQACALADAKFFAEEAADQNGEQP